MSAFLFLVNPTKAYDPYPDWAAWAPLIADGEHPPTTWNTGTRRRGIVPGDLGLIIKVGVDPRGLVGLATVTSEIYVGPHWNPEARLLETGYVDLAMDDVLDLDDPLPLSLLRQLAPGVLWTPRQSGSQIPDDAAAAVLELLR